MSKECEQLHRFFNSLPRIKFPFENENVPSNGLYILFEKGEFSHNCDRIVRIGTHTGSNQLRSRLKQHFINENKDRSIFRKNIGRCFLNIEKNPYLDVWDICFTSTENIKKFGYLINKSFQECLEKRISNYIQNNFSFCLLKINDKEKRLKIESELISTISQCNECKPSKNWLGLKSPKEKIRINGLWQVNELNNKPMSLDEVKP